MKTAAIVSEYNPLHNGHVYHIQKTREHADAVVCVMSGNAVQRGDFAVLDKFSRAELAIKAGADLVVELPCAFACSSADRFAEGAMDIVAALPDIDTISFGCEDDDPTALYAAAEFIKNAPQNGDIRLLMHEGQTFAAAAHAVLSRTDTRAAECLSSPNNLLAAEYLAHMPDGVSPLLIKRVGVSHDSFETVCGYASASYIRMGLADNKSVDTLVPEYTITALEKAKKEGKLSGGIAAIESAVLYRFRTMTDAEFDTIPDSNSGLADRFRAAVSARSLSELIELASAKRYTAARVRRAVLHAILKIDESYYRGVPYIRVLAANETGTAILKNSRLPVSHSLKRLSEQSEYASMHCALEARASAVFALTLPCPDGAKLDYTYRFTLSPKRGE